MSGTQNPASAGASGGQSISALGTAPKIAATDTVLGVFAGAVQNGTVADLVAAGLPETVAKQSDITEALSSSALGQYTVQAQTSAQQSKLSATQAGASQAAAGVHSQAAAQSASDAATILAGSQSAASQAMAGAESAQNVIQAAGNVLNQAAFRMSQGMGGGLPFIARGWWDAATNSPALTSGSGAAGDAYVVVNAGGTSLDGQTGWEPFDLAYFNGITWVRGPGAGVPVAAQQFVATVAAQIADNQLGRTSGDNVFEIADPVGYLLSCIDASGNLTTAGSRLAFGSFALDASATAMLQVSDQNGFVGFEIDSSGAIQSPAGAVAPNLGPVSFEVVEDGLEGVSIIDQLGYVGFDTTGAFGTVSGLSGGFTAEDIRSHDSVNLARSALLARRWASANHAAPVWGYSFCDSSGQSELMGWYSVPPRTVNTPANLGALMMGASVYGNGANDTSQTTFSPAGGSSALQPIVGTSYELSTASLNGRPGNQLCSYKPADVTVSASSTDATQCILTTTDTAIDFTKGIWSAASGNTGTCPGLQVGDNIQITGFTGDAAVMNIKPLIYGYTQIWTVAAVSAQSLTLTLNTNNNGGSDNPVAVSAAAGITIEIVWGGSANYIGEAQCVQASVAFRKFQLQARGLIEDSSRQLVTYCSAIGGQSITQLSKGANPNIYERGITAFAALKTLATTANVTFGAYLIEWLQGGSDPNTDYATYSAALEAYHDDKAADFMAISGQSLPPRMEIAVLSQFNTVTHDNMGVERAQVDYCEANPDRAYCVGAMYPAYDYYVHNASNGETWMGAMRAKARDRLFNGGVIPFPVRMYQATARGNQVLVDFQAPVPPLVIKPAGVGQRDTLLPNYGLVAVDANGNMLTIASTELVGDLTILITLAAAVPDGAWIYCAPAGNYGADGSSNIFDSDPTVAAIPYLWTAGDGTTFPEQELAASGTPMSLANPAVPYALQITQG